MAVLAAEGYRVGLGDLRNLQLEVGACDVVTPVELLEHLPDQVPALRRAPELVRLAARCTSRPRMRVDA